MGVRLNASQRPGARSRSASHRVVPGGVLSRVLRALVPAGFPPASGRDHLSPDGRAPHLVALGNVAASIAKRHLI